MSSRIFVISRIYSQNKLLGFKLMDSRTSETRTMSCQQAEIALRNGGKIANLIYENGKLKGYGGRLERYTAVNTFGEILTPRSLTIFYKLEDCKNDCYVCGIYNGTRLTLNKEELFKYSKSMIITNYKVYRDKSNIIKIVPISGETQVEDDTHITNKYITTVKRYKLPDLIPNETFNFGYRSGSIGAHFKKEYKYKLPWITTTMIYKHRGLIYKSPDNSKTLYGYNEVLRHCRCNEHINITGIKIGENHQLIFNFNSKDYLLEDIILIGSNWRSISNTKYSITSDKLTDTIIALGQIGILIFSVKLVFNSNNSMQQPKLNVKCIPYSKIKDIDKLTNQLVLNNIYSDIINEEDVEYILKLAKTSVYKLNFNNKASDAVKGYSIKSEANDNKALKYAEGVSCRHIGSIGPYSLICEEFIRSFIENEFIFSIEPGEFAYFNCYSDDLIRGSGENVNLTKINGDYRVEDNTIPLRYIAYYVLYKNGKLTEFNKILASLGQLKEIIDKYIWGIDVTDKYVVIYISDMRVVYGIQELTVEYIADIEESDSGAKAANRMTTKMGLIGLQASIDDKGYVFDWANDTMIDQRPAIKGIIITDSNRDKQFVLNVMSDVDIIDKRVRKLYSLGKITLAFKASNLDQSFNIKRGSLVNVGINLENASVEDLDKLLSYQFRGFIQNQISINGEVVRINEKSIQYGMAFITRNANILYACDISNLELNFNLIRDRTFNTNKATDENKLGLLKLCIANVPKRKSKPRDMSINLVKLVARLLFTGEKRTAVLDKLDKGFKQMEK